MSAYTNRLERMTDKQLCREARHVSLARREVGGWRFCRDWVDVRWEAKRRGILEQIDQAEQEALTELRERRRVVG